MFEESSIIIPVIGYTIFISASVALLIRPIRDIIYNDPDDDQRYSRRLTLMAIPPSAVSHWLIQVVILGVCVINGVDYWRDIEFNNRYKTPQRITPAQLLTTNSDSIPRYVRISPVLPTRSGVVEARSKAFITIGEDYYYAARLTNEDTIDTNAPLRIFFQQKHDEENEPSGDIPLIVLGRYRPDNHLDSRVSDMFKEEGYTVDYNNYLIEEDVLPLPIWKTWLLFFLAGLLGIIQLVLVLMALRRRIDGSQRAV